MKTYEELADELDELEADLHDVQWALQNLAIQPDKNAAWMYVGLPKASRNVIGRMPVRVLRAALEAQQCALEEEVSAAKHRLGKQG